MKYYLIVGEASGDLHASNLMRALQQEDSQADFRFFGGDKMSAVGGSRVKHYKELAYMGFIPVLLHLRTILRNMRQCQEDIVAWQPDVVILVDYPGFNLKIAEYIKKNTQIPVYYYISPKIWAWKEYRIKNIKRDVDELFSILPFEIDFFAGYRYPIHYVGNPCVDAVDEYCKGNVETFGAFAAENGLNDKPVIALLAGSRKQEIKDNLPKMLEAAAPFTKDLLLFDCGDFSQGSPFYNMFGGEVEVKLMNEMGYDAGIIGNHEFDLGLDNMARLFKMADFPVVCANYGVQGTVLEGLVKPYVILERKGIKVGVFGLSPALEGLVQAKNCEGVVFENPIEAAQRVADILKNREKCDLVVCLSHLGWQGKPYSDETLILNTRNIDIVLGGHSHSYFDKTLFYKNLDGKEISLQQMGKNAVYVGKMKVRMEKN